MFSVYEGLARCVLLYSGKSRITFPAQVVKDTFPNHESLVAARLATQDELDIMEREADLNTVWWIPLSWCMTMTKVWNK